MLVLYETPAGYALFKLLDDGKLEKPDDLYKDFETPELANKALKLKAFSKFENTTEALSAVTALVEGKMSKSLKSFLKDELSDKDLKSSLVVGDAKLGGAIAKKFGIKVIADSSTSELIRGIRSQLSSLITGLAESDMNAMVLGLSHSLSRYKLKFSPDKVDTMIVQAIALLDDLDKELNTYAMRVKEWYGWHFPEMGKVLVDNLAYAKTIKAMSFRTNCSATDFSSILPEEIEAEIKVLAEVSMGTEISEEDMTNISYLADQVISISEYRAQLFDYLKNRMMAIAPNLTALVGELVGARLIAHAGSLLSLAKAPASTVQILGAEKALFRALKSKHDTPKYGLIYHASLIGQAGPKVKGKMARVVAAKTSLAVRCDAMGEGDATPDMGLAARAKIEARLRQLEGKAARGANSVAGTGKSPQAKFEMKGVKAYNSATDAVMTPVEDKANGEETPVKPKKEKKDKKEKKTEESPAAEEKSEKKKKRKADEADGAEDKKDKKKKSKKKSTEDDA